MDFLILAKGIYDFKNINNWDAYVHKDFNDKVNHLFIRGTKLWDEYYIINSFRECDFKAFLVIYIAPQNVSDRVG